MNWTSESKKKLINTRIIPAIIMLIFLIFLLGFNHYVFYLAGNSLQDNIYIPLYILAILLITSVGYWVCYELANGFIQDKKAALFQALFMAIALPIWGVHYYAAKGEGKIIGEYIAIDFLPYLFFLDFRFFPLLVLILLLPLFSYPLIKILVLKRTPNQILYKNYFKNILLFIASYLVIWILFRTYLLLHLIPDGLYYILLCIIVPAAHDIGGFFGGMFFGRKFFVKKLAPAISPNKTIEGAIAGILSGIFTIFAFSIFYYFIFKNNENTSSNDLISRLIFIYKTTGFHLKILGIANFIIFAPAFGLTGDLYFSYLKRRLDLKDFSKILKGHGGMLDRIDSIAFVFVLLFILAAIL